MNIVRALEVALPELPERIVRQNPPKLHPSVIAKEHIERGQPVVLVKMPGSELVFRFQPVQWRLVQLFDGSHSYEEIAALSQEHAGVAVSADDLRELGSFLQNDTPLMYKTAVERNMALQEELRSSRKKRRRFQGLDFTDIRVKTWDDADHYITWLYPKLRFMFTPWFVWSSVGLFILMGWMWADRFGEIWADSFAFYDFTSKSGQDLLEFWFLFGAMAAIHETAHGLVGKHFGATIEKMGFTLMYFAPTFFCDATQVWVIGSRWARIATAFAGIWLDLIVCFFATAVWWGTATGMPIHDFAYKVMMVTGIGVSVLNLNPLIKLDGYLIFSELVAESMLKESSTEYLSSWVRKYIFRLPVDVPYVPRRKRTFFAVYGILSGLYSYSLLSVLMIITYHILRRFTPEWAFVPALAIGYWVFQSRVKKVVSFMKKLYLDKKERVRAWFTPVRIAGVATAAALLVFLPVWPDFLRGQFVLSAEQTAVLRATVSGTVSSVLVQEGQNVSAGDPLLRMRNLDLESKAAHAWAQLSGANARLTQAVLRYSDVAGAEQDRKQRVEMSSVLSEQVGQLSIASPMSGVVVTAHTADLAGRSLAEGDPLLEIANTSQMKAEVYIPEFAMRDIRVGQAVHLLVDGHLGYLTGPLTSLSATVASAAHGMLPQEQLQGLNPPRFYVATVILKNDGFLQPGMIGTAKVRVGQRSLAGFGLRFVRDFASRKIW